jgi:uncharacterized RDD family membrane protein YckC
MASGRRPFRLSAEGRIREIPTPEGVPIHFTLADIGQRLNAFIIDMLVIALVTLVIGVLGLMLMLVQPSLALVGGSLGILVIFLLWNFYFTWFELNWQGSTPGKRRVKIRSISATGGPASTDAIIARNLMRDVELFIPLVAIVAALTSEGSGWLEFGALAWLLLFALLPLFNRDRLRVGDLVAGTIVVRSPQSGLLRDLTQEQVRAPYSFTPEQLDVYGIYELQVLEQVLRGDEQRDHGVAVETVARKIMGKIRWSGAAVELEPFLRAFYSALRARLENRLLLGRRREDKHDK